MSVPLTVGYVTDQGVKALVVYCTNTASYCSHSGYIPLSVLPPELEIRTLAPRCRCTVCGARAASVRPDYSIWTQSTHRTVGW